jgi:hypothetical protein
MKKKYLQMEEPFVLSESFSEIQENVNLAKRKMGTHEISKSETSCCQ